MCGEIDFWENYVSGKLIWGKLTCGKCLWPGRGKSDFGGLQNYGNLILNSVKCSESAGLPGSRASQLSSCAPWNCNGHCILICSRSPGCKPHTCRKDCLALAWACMLTSRHLQSASTQRRVAEKLNWLLYLYWYVAGRRFDLAA